jgi:hypothetical protein
MEFIMKLKDDAQRIREWMSVMEVRPEDYVGPDTSGNVEYSAEGKDGVITKVIAVLRRGNSAKYTRLANNFQRLAELKKETDRINEELKDDLRDALAFMFRPEDAAYTRVVETAQFVLSISKNPEAATTVRYAEVLKALEKELTPELVEVMKTIKAKYTSMQKAKPPYITGVMKKTSESMELSEGIWDSIKGMWSKFTNSVKNWLSGYDNRLNALKAQVGIHESKKTTHKKKIKESNWRPMTGGFPTPVDALHSLVVSQALDDELLGMDLEDMFVYYHNGAWYAHDGMDVDGDNYIPLPAGARYPTEQEKNIILNKFGIHESKKTTHKKKIKESREFELNDLLSRTAKLLKR